MRLGYFTMPVHPMHRNWTETLKEDREAVILADKLGFASALVGEHLTDACENVPNAMTFLATLIHATTQIKLGTGTSNLSQKHPVLIAGQALARNLILVTHNTDEFGRVPRLRVEDWQI